jgi:hypothetical protein
MAARSALGFVREGKPAPHPATRNNRLAFDRVPLAGLAGGYPGATLRRGGPLGVAALLAFPAAARLSPARPSGCKSGAKFARTYAVLSFTYQRHQ